MQNNTYEFDPLQYIDPQYLLPTEYSQDEKNARLQEMGFSFRETQGGLKTDFDCNQFALYLINCIYGIHDKNGNYYLYNRCGYFEEFDALSMGKLVKYIINQCGHYWENQWEERGLAAYYRSIRTVDPIFAKTETINLKNGIFDLNSMQLLPHAPEICDTIQIPMAYDPEATCPRFEQFLLEITEGDTERIAVLQELMGYCLINSTKAEKMFFLYGQGSNGKSVFAKVLEFLVGKENISAVSLSEFSSNFGIEPLIHSKVNLAAENEVSGKLSSEKLKAVVSGDEVNIQRKYKSSITAHLSCKIIFLLNTLPSVNDVTHGFFRRIMLIPFNRTFTDETKDVELFNKLLKESPGILNYAIQGLIRLKRNMYRFTVSKAMEEALQQYKNSQNPTLDFFRAMYERCEGESILRSTLYNDFTTYCDNQGCERLSRVDFWKRLKVAANDPNNGIELSFKEIRGYEYICNYKKKYPVNDMFQL